MTIMDSLFELEQTDDLERRIRVVVAKMQAVPGWPADDPRDRALARELIELHPRMNLPAELAAFTQWITDYKPPRGKRVNYRARVVTWCNRAVSRPAGRAGVRGDRNARGRAGTAPAGPAAFDGLASSL